ncbi:MAG: hypothetical protein KDK51_02655 [Deltaproteobacteria bacterium]|nr:hypothetical protein [Deltaproteobacteria bacterium]
MPEEKVKIYPSEGSTEVPVNTIVAIYIKPSANVQADDIKSDFFAMTTCQEADPLAQKQESTDNKNNQDDKKETKQSSPFTSTKVEFYTQILEYTPESQTQQSSAGNPSEGTGLLAYLVPKSTTDSDTPLQPGTRYCISSKPFKNKNKEVIAGMTASFTTEEIPGFLYNEDAEINITQDEIAASNDYIVLDFGDKSIEPNTLKKSITLCQKDTTQDNQGPCEYYGKKVGFEMFMFENLIRSDDQDYNSMQSNLFSITPTGQDPSTEEYRIVIDITLGTSKNPDDSALVKTIKVGETPQGATLLTNAVAEQGDTYYQSFAIGAKSK